MDRLVSEVVLVARGRQIQSRPAITLADIRLALALPAYLALAWLVPERNWYGLCNWIVTQLRRANPLAGAIAAAGASSLGGSLPQTIATRLEALRLESVFQCLREYRPRGWRPAIVLEGREHLDQALAAGRGAVLWVGHTVFHGLVLKKCLAEAGFALSHVSRPEHGLSKSRFGIAVLNPLRTRAENRYLRRRIVIRRGAEQCAMRAALRDLATNGIVSITAGAWEGRQIAYLPFLGGTMPLATGAPALAHATGAALLPVFVTRRDGVIRIVLASPLRVDRHCDRDAQIATAVMEFAAHLQALVREHPEQWRAWAHLRSRC